MKLKVNETGLIANLGSVFSDRSKVISELLQNGRRAGASRIDVTTTMEGTTLKSITISDNGCGIDDFATLLNIAQSGWDEDVQQSDLPYGMGALAMLFAADDIIIESNGQVATINSTELLQGNEVPDPIASENTSAEETGTRITLINPKMPDMPSHRTHHTDDEIIAIWVSAAASGFSIPVTINGKAVEQPMSQENMLKLPGAECHQTPMGTLVVQTFDKEFLVLLQQAEIYRGHHRYFATTNAFYSTNEIKALMPGREKIINEEEEVAKYTKALHDVQVKRLKRIRQDMNDDVAFLDAHFEDVVRWDVSMLNEINYLPDAAFEKAGYPDMAEDSFMREQGEADGITPETETLVITSDCINEIGVVAAMFFHLCDAVVLNSKLDPSHWIHALTHEAGDHSFVITGDAEHTFTSASGYNDNACMVPAGIGFFEITNTTLERTVALHDGLIVSNDDYQVHNVTNEAKCDVLIQDIHALNGLDCRSILTQSSSYTDEYGNYMEHEWLSPDNKVLCNLIRMALGKGHADYIRDALGTLPVDVLEALKGSPIVLTSNGKELAAQESSSAAV